jgi:predicted ATP-dependent endonuclease of OLD family
VDLAEPHEIVRLHKAAGKTLARQVPSVQTFDFQKAKQKIRRMGNEEMLFANHAILTEGKSDQGVVKALFDIKGVASDVHSVSVVDCDNADNQPDYINVCSHLGIEFYVIHDEDNPTKDASQKKRNEKIANAVSAADQKQPSLHRYVPDLETTMGKPTHCGLDVLLACLDGKTYGDISAQYPELVKPVDQFVSTRLAPPIIKPPAAPSQKN